VGCSARPRHGPSWRYRIRARTIKIQRSLPAILHLIQFAAGNAGEVVHAPISLLPSPLPRSAYDQVVALARDFNVLVHRASNDHAFICSSLERFNPPGTLLFPPALRSYVLPPRQCCACGQLHCEPAGHLQEGLRRRQETGAVLDLALALHCGTVARVRVRVCFEPLECCVARSGDRAGAA